MHLRLSKPPMHCRYCDRDLFKHSSLSYYLCNCDKVCEECRRAMDYHPRKIKVKDIIVQSYYVYNPHLKSMILQYKECYDEALADVFFYELAPRLRFKYRGFTIVVAPSSKSNLKRRRFNHMELMCRIIGLPIADILEKVQDTSQNNLNFNSRLKMINNIALKNGASIPDQILLIDDILTTGSTIYGAYQALKKPNNRVIPLAFCYVDNPGHSKI